MLPSPRIVVIDDELSDMRAIVEGLNSLGAAAVGFHYSAESELPQFPCLRILFLDLHLHPGAGDTERQITYTIDLLSRVVAREHGPYAIVLWSLHDEERDRFEARLFERIPQLEIPAPLAVMALKKADHLALHENRAVMDPKALGTEVLNRISRNPQVAALLAWEEHVALAVNDTICQIFQMARQENSAAADSLTNILGELAIAAAGLENAGRNAFRASNEVLVQIISDRLLHRTIGGELEQQWRSAVTIRKSKEPNLSLPLAARLNNLLHLENGQFEACRRGSVIDLSSLSEKQFLGIWGYSRDAILPAFDREKKGLTPNFWFMAQVRPPCDEAQQNEGLFTYVLGIGIIPGENKKDVGNIWIKSTKNWDFLWTSPPLVASDNRIMYLALHLRFVAGLPEKKVNRLRLKASYRLREPILAEISQKLHSYGDRPGIISFRTK